MPDQLIVDVRSVGRGFQIDIIYRDVRVRVSDAEPLWWQSLDDRAQYQWADACWGDAVLRQRKMKGVIVDGAVRGGG